MIITIPVEEILMQALVFLRVGAVFFALPVFGDPPTPVRARILLALSFSWAIQGIIPPEWMGTIPDEPFAYGILVLREVLIGLMLGFVAKLTFAGLTMAASIVGYQMGFGTASLLVPDAEQQMDGFTAFHRILMMLIFFSLNLHMVYLQSISESFRLIPVGMANPHPDLLGLFTAWSAAIFSTAIQLAAPILVALMFTMAALGLVARTVPQMNVFTLSFPFSFMVGLLVYISTMVFFPGWVQEYFVREQENILLTIKGLAPS